MKVAVTGGTGFVGRRIVAQAEQDARFTVVPTARRPQPGERLLDLTRPATLPTALDGVDAVIHCAVGDHEVTVAGSQRLLDAAREAHVRRVVVLSSIAVYGHASGVVDERTPTAPTSAYGQWKVEVERSTRAARDIETVLLRPTIVYGPGSHWWIELPLERIRSGRWRDLGDVGRGTCNPVHVQDVAAAALAAVAHPDAPGQVFNVDGGTPLTWTQWYRRLAELDAAGPLRPLGPTGWRLRAAARVPVAAAARLGAPVPGLPGLPGRGDLGLFGLEATYPPSHAEGVLGWRPRVDLQEGLAAAVRGS